MLTKENKEKWLEALKSGKYQHHTGKLGSASDGYCCIGVYCEVFGLPYDGHQITTDYAKEECNKTGRFYPEVDDVIGYENVKKLTSINDSSRDYKRVIEYIEENL